MKNCKLGRRASGRADEQVSERASGRENHLADARLDPLARFGTVPPAGRATLAALLWRKSISRWQINLRAAGARNQPARRGKQPSESGLMLGRRRRRRRREKGFSSATWIQAVQLSACCSPSPALELNIQPTCWPRGLAPLAGRQTKECSLREA